jgi:hypothetical protein
MTFVYSPSGPTASLKLFVDGDDLFTNENLPLLDARTFERTYIGKSWWASDLYLDAKFRFLGVYNRSLADQDVLEQHLCAVTCSPCPAGSFCPVSARGAPIANTCAAGLYCPTVPASVIPAPKGSYAPVARLTAAAPCPAGSYTKTTGASACLPLGSIPRTTDLTAGPSGKTIEAAAVVTGMQKVRASLTSAPAQTRKVGLIVHTF